MRSTLAWNSTEFTSPPGAVIQPPSQAPIIQPAAQASDLQLELARPQGKTEAYEQSMNAMSQISERSMMWEVVELAGACMSF